MVSYAEFEYGTYKLHKQSFVSNSWKLTQLKWKKGVETRGKPLSTNYETVNHWTGVTGPTASEGLKLINSVDIQSWNLCASLPTKL